MIFRHAISAAIFALSAQTGIAETESKKPNEANRIDVQQRFTSKLFETHLALDGRAGRISSYLKACGNKGLARAVENTMTKNVFHITEKSGVLELPEMKSGVATRNDLVTSARIAHSGFMGYLLGVEQTADWIVKTEARADFCGAALSDADRIIENASR